MLGEPSAIVATDEVALLLEGFVKHNDGQPGQCTREQRRQLNELANRHGRDKFRGAAKAWLKDSPWNAQTTHPFSGFINGFESYAAVAPFQEKAAKQKAEQQTNVDRAAEFHRRKARVDYGTLKADFLATLPQADLDHIKQVADAKGFDDMPPDNGREFQLEEIEFFKQKTAEELKLSKDFSSLSIK